MAVRVQLSPCVSSIDRRGGLLALLLAAAPGVAGRVAAQATTQDHPGQYSAADIEAGSRLYTGQCALCHGTNGDLVADVDLRRGRFRRSVSDEDLARVILAGVPDAGMPAFKLQPFEIDGLVAFIRAGFDVSGAAVKVGYGADSRRGTGTARVVREGRSARIRAGDGVADAVGRQDAHG